MLTSLAHPLRHRTRRLLGSPGLSSWVWVSGVQASGNGQSWLFGACAGLDRVFQYQGLHRAQSQTYLVIRLRFLAALACLGPTPKEAANIGRHICLFGSTVALLLSNDVDC